MRVTTIPTELVAQESLSAGDTVYLQVSSGKSAIRVSRVDDEPTNILRGIRLAFGDKPYPVTVLSDPAKIWVWAENGPSADLEYITI